MTNYLEITDDQLKRLDRESFQFDHQLADDPALKLDALKQLILRLPPEQVYASSSKVSLNTDLDRAHKEHAIDSGLELALAELETSDTFVMVRSPETDPALRGAFGKIRQSIEAHLRRCEERCTNATAYLFLASPGGVTPYHLDRYSTLLLQLEGSKTVSTWNPWNNGQVSEAELEQFFARSHQQAPQYDDRFQAEVTNTEISPGQGLHIPFVAPHCVHNGPQVSASISIIFNTLESRRLGNALRFNHLLRGKMGLRPSAVHQDGSRLNHQAKSLAYRVARKLSLA